MSRVFLAGLCYWAVVSGGCGAASSRTVALPGKDVAGFAVEGGKLFLWGDDAFEIDLQSGKQQRLITGRFEEGGCLLAGGLILNSIEPRELIWLRLADRRRFVIDTGVDTRDAIAVTLLGHHGVLLIHKRQQVRFYDLPSPMKDGWTETELYTIYTPSTEGGLVMADVDGDGLPDLLCGNYWMKSPTSFELPWREFAIDTWNEEEGSAMLRLAWDGAVRVAAQREMRPARAAWFERPADPRQLWTVHQLTSGQGFSAVVFIKKDLILLERGAGGRVLFFRRAGNGFEAGKELIRTNNGVGLAVLQSRELLVVEKSQAVLLRW